MCQCSAHLVMISQRESYRRAQASGSDNRPEFPEPHKSHGRATFWPINPEWGDPRTEDSCPMRHADAIDWRDCVRKRGAPFSGGGGGVK